MKKKYLLLLILLLGGFLRFYNIGNESFWLDEGQTATATSQNFGKLMSDLFFGGNLLPEYYVANADLPSYYTLLFVWSRVFGITEVSLRSLSALFDIASIALTFFLAKRFIGQKGALIASFLYSISLSLIYASQDARPYSLHVLLALASAYMLIKALDNNKNSNWVGFVAAAIIGLYNHFLFVLFVGAMAAYVLLRFKEYINKPVIYGCSGLFLTDEEKYFFEKEWERGVPINPKIL